MGGASSRGNYDFSQASSSQGAAQSDLPKSSKEENVKKTSNRYNVTEKDTTSSAPETATTADEDAQDVEEKSVPAKSKSEGPDDVQTTAVSGTETETSGETPSQAVDPDKGTKSADTDTERLAEQVSNVALESESRRRESGPPCLVAVRFPSSSLETLQQSSMKSATVLENYGGTCVGHTEKITTSSGEWAEGMLLAFFSFPSALKASEWLASEADVQKQEWLQEVDVVILPQNKAINPDLPVFMFVDHDLQGDEMANFKERYFDALRPLLEAMDCTPWVVCDYPLEQPRHLWRPHYIAIYQFKTIDDVRKLEQSDDFQALKLYCDGVSKSDALLFEL